MDHKQRVDLWIHVIRSLAEHMKISEKDAAERIVDEIIREAERLKEKPLQIDDQAIDAT